MQENSHLNRLIGYIADGETVLLNGEIIQALSYFNVYQMSAQFYDELQKAGFSDDQVTVTTFVSWLNSKGIAQTLTASQAGLVSNLTNYRTYPFVPAYKDIMWVTRVLRQLLEGMSTRDIYLLAIYLEMEIETHDVKNTILSRDSARIKTLLEILQKQYQKHVEIHINSSAKEAADEPRENRIPSA